MKKLKKLKLKECSFLTDDELKGIKGGSGWYYLNGGVTYVLDPVIITAPYPNRSCSACRKFEEMNGTVGAYGPDRAVGGTTTPFGEWLFKSLWPHDPGCPWR